MPDLAPGTSRTTLVVCLGAVWILWGSIFLAIRLVVNEVDPFQAMAQRYAIAGTILTVIVLARGGRRGMRVTREELVALVLTGVLLLGFGNGFQALAQVSGLPSGVAALIVASVPAWAVVIRLLTGDRPSRGTLLGVSIGIVGLVVLIGLDQGGSSSIPLLAAAMCMGAAISWTVGSFLQGRLAMPRDVVTIAAYQQLVAAVCSTTLAVVSRERFSMDYTPRAWWALGYLIVACSIIAFLAFAWLLTHVPLSLTATHTYVNPVVAVFLGWLVLSEPVGLPVLLGGGIVVGAVVLIVNAERRPAPVAPVAAEPAPPA